MHDWVIGVAPLVLRSVKGGGRVIPPARGTRNPDRNLEHSPNSPKSPYTHAHTYTHSLFSFYISLSQSKFLIITMFFLLPSFKALFSVPKIFHFCLSKTSL